MMNVLCWLVAGWFTVVGFLTDFSFNFRGAFEHLTMAVCVCFILKTFVLRNMLINFIFFYCLFRDNNCSLSGSMDRNVMP